MKQLLNLERRAALTATPQALAWDGTMLWLSSRDRGTLYQVDVDHWKIVAEIDPPGVVWAGVLTNEDGGSPLAKG